MTIITVQADGMVSALVLNVIVNATNKKGGRYMVGRPVNNTSTNIPLSFRRTSDYGNY
jgi:hypothetical protein